MNAYQHRGAADDRLRTEAGRVTNSYAATSPRMVASGMLRTRMKRLANRGEAALDRLAAIEASITNLGDEDLLDLADIFKAEPRPVLGEMTFAEMARRNISL